MVPGMLCQAGADLGQRYFGRRIGFAFGVVIGVEQAIDGRFPRLGHADFHGLANQRTQFGQNERIRFQRVVMRIGVMSGLLVNPLSILSRSLRIGVAAGEAATRFISRASQC